MIPAAYQSESGGVGLVLAGIAGISAATANWLTAFCVTPACKAQKKAAKQNLEAAELYLEAEKAGVVAAGIQQQTAAERTQAFLVVGAGALALGALYLTR